jgi:FKBP-type peptidyl-prolyl cis-trans isomerase
MCSRTLTLLAALGVLATAAGCGSKGNNSAGSTGPAGSCQVQVSGAQGSKPQVTVPDCAAPTTLQSKDVITGTGAAAKAGDTMLTQYTLLDWGTKKLVQSSYNGGEPFAVAPLGRARVIEAWNEGLVGMRQGGRRVLIAPPDKAYGPQGAPPDIPPNATLVFVIDAVRVTAAR